MTSSSVATPEQLIASFPHPDLPPIEGQPTYEKIAAIKSLLAANAASIQTTRGGGDNGYLGILLSPAVYATINAIPWIDPPNPGATPVIPPNATSAQIGEAVRVHTENLRQWREFTNLQQALKKQLIAAVNPIYFRAIKHRHVGFANHSIREMLTHLIDQYGAITPIDLQNNMADFSKKWDPNQPFEVLIDQIEEAVDFADAGGQPYTAQQIINNAYTIVFQTGMFFDDCKTWRAKPDADKTWQNFKTHFGEAQRQLRLQTATMQSAGYHEAKLVSYWAHQ